MAHEIEAARPLPSRIRSDGWTWAVVGLSLAFVALHLWLSRGMDAPFLFSDEVGYLLDARYLSGVGPAPQHPYVPFYSVGYPLLLAPLSWIFGHPTGVYHGALLGNALLGGVTIPILYAIGREVLGLVPKHALLAAGLAGAYPAFLLNTTIVWAENLLPPLVALHVLFVYRALRRGSFVWLVALAVTAAALYTTHPRTLPFVGATGVLLGWMGLRRLAPPTHAAAALGVLAFLGVCGKVLNDHVREAVYRQVSGGGPGDVGGSGEFVVSAIKDPSTYGEALVRALGQAWYLCATSAGLWALGVGFLACIVWRGRTGGPVPARDQARAYTAGFMLVALLASFPPNALVFAMKPSDSHYAFYGRYMEAVSPVALLAGAAALLLIQGRRRRLIAMGAAAGATVLLALIVNVDSPALERAEVSPVVVLAALFPGGVSSWTDLVGFDLLRATVIALAGMALFAAVPARWAGMAVAVVAGAFVASAVVVAERVIHPFAVGLTSPNTLQSTLDSLPPGEPIAYALASYDQTALPAYQFAIDDREFSLFDTGDGEEPASDVIVATLTEPRLRGRGARIAAFETSKDQAIWVRRGRLQRRLAGRGRLFPGQIGDPLPASARNSRITVKDRISRPLHVVGGHPFALRLSVTHTGSGSPWPQPRDATKGRDAVYVVGSWHPGTGQSNRISSQPTPLPRTLAPGATLEMKLTLTAVDAHGDPLRPGRYTVDLTPHQEGIGFFPDRPDLPFEFPVEVTEAG